MDNKEVQQDLLTGKLKRKALNNRSAATIQIKHRRMERRRKLRIVEHESLVDQDMIACCRSCSEQIRLDSHWANGNALTDGLRRHRKSESMLKNLTIHSNLSCDCYCCLVVFVFRRLQILYFLREMVMN